MLASPLDHLVLPVRDIATARARLSQLGFTVAADGRHPFGTENCCVYFRDGTFIEPLGVASQVECEAAIRAGNQFVARDRAFRFRNGSEGLSAIVMGSDDARADHELFRQSGISGGDMLEFSRPMRFPDGTEATAGFRLAFAADLRAPDFFAFTCQRINVPAADRSALETHANGARAIRRVLLHDTQPADFRAFLACVTRSEAVAEDPEGMDIAASNATIRILNADGLMALDGETADPSRRGLSGKAVAFAVADVDATQRLFYDAGVSHTRYSDSLFVPHQPGQGVSFIFSGE